MLTILNQAWAALPSIKTIIPNLEHGSCFDGWPEGLPHSRVPRVVFRDCCVSKDAVLRWADGFDAPCVMTQNFYRGTEGRLDGIHYPEWDYLEVKGQTDPDSGRIVLGTREVELRLDDPDNEGHDEVQFDEGINFPDVFYEY